MYLSLTFLFAPTKFAKLLQRHRAARILRQPLITAPTISTTYPPQILVRLHRGLGISAMATPRQNNIPIIHIYQALITPA